tara:strand:- start:444 stop:638 length:195 start_codon:yes stop_codon:yes gene_type:complete
VSQFEPSAHSTVIAEDDQIILQATSIIRTPHHAQPPHHCHTNPQSQLPQEAPQAQDNENNALND